MMISHTDVGYGEGDYGDVSPVPLESHDPWAKSLHLIMIEHKMIEMQV